MKCPLRHGFDVNLIGKTGAVTQDCLKEECAWWSSEADACAVMITAGNLAGLVAIGDTILEKIPDE